MSLANNIYYIFESWVGVCTW